MDLIVCAAVLGFYAGLWAGSWVSDYAWRKKGDARNGVNTMRSNGRFYTVSSAGFYDTRWDDKK